MKMDRRTVAPDCERPAKMNGTCFYCSEPVGGQHKEECVAFTKIVKVRAIVEYEVEVPNASGKDEVEFHRNEGSWCSSNIIDELRRFSDDNDDCLCSRITYEYIGDA